MLDKKRAHNRDKIFRHEGQWRRDQGERAPLKIAGIQSDEFVLFLARGLGRFAFVIAVVVAVTVNQMRTHNDNVGRSTISQDRRMQADDQSHDREKKGS